MKPDNFDRIKEYMVLRANVVSALGKLTSIDECVSLTLTSNSKSIVLTDEHLGKSFIENLQDVMISNMQASLQKIDNDLIPL